MNTTFLEKTSLLISGARLTVQAKCRCGRLVTAVESFAGKFVTCKHCHAGVRMPPAEVTRVDFEPLGPELEPTVLMKPVPQRRLWTSQLLVGALGGSVISALLGIGFMIGLRWNDQPRVADERPSIVQPVEMDPVPAPVEPIREPVAASRVECIPANFDLVREKFSNFKLTDSKTVDGVRVWTWSCPKWKGVFVLAGTDESHIHQIKAYFAGDDPLVNQSFAISHATKLFAESHEISRLISRSIGDCPRLPATIRVGETRFTYTVEKGASIVTAESAFAPPETPDADLGNQPLLPLDFMKIRKMFRLYDTEGGIPGLGRMWVWHRKNPGIHIMAYGSDDSHLTACTVIADAPPETEKGGDDMLIAIHYVGKMSDDPAKVASDLRRFWNAGPSLPAVLECHGIRFTFSIERGESVILCVPNK
jgi:hypothetical protein